MRKISLPFEGSHCKSENQYTDHKVDNQAEYLPAFHDRLNGEPEIDLKAFSFAHLLRFDSRPLRHRRENPA